MSGSCIYRGRLMHHRLGPREHLFSHAVYMCLVDLDDLEGLAPRLRRLGSSIASADHLGDPGRSIRRNVLDYLELHGVDLEGGRILLLTNPRVLGYVFNPLSVYYCHGADGQLECVVAEVHNTYGERHCYLLRPSQNGRCEARKEFYVSPFFTVDGRYRMTFARLDERLAITMELVQDGEPVFRSSLTGRREPLTTANLARTMLRLPLMPARVSALIRVHGVRLWLAGLRPVPRPSHAPQERVG